MDVQSETTQFRQICRTCMKTNESADSGFLQRNNERIHFLSIYEYPSKDNALTIMELLVNTTPQLLIQPDDELPSIICISCLQKLLSLNEFQQMCIRSDCHMRSLLEYDVLESKFSQMQEMPATPATTASFDAVDPDHEDPLQSCRIDGGATSAKEIKSVLKLELAEEHVKKEQNDVNNHDETVDTTGIAAKTDKKKRHKGDKSIADTTDRINGKKKDIKCRENFKKSRKQKSKTKSATEESGQDLGTAVGSTIMKQNSIEQTESIEDTFAGDNLANPEGYKCDECPRRFAKQQSLAAHKQWHRKSDRKAGIDIHECKLCAKQFKSRRMLIRHKRIHHRPEDDPLKPYVCEYCNKAFQQSCTLKDHIRTHTGEQPYLCSECGRAFNSSSNLKQHLLRHSGLKRYECPDCPKKFPCLSDLASHKAVHRKHKPHICDICGSCFGKPYQLKKHKMYHNGEKPHKCEYCEMRFVCADHMRRHTRTHTGEKPYKCKYCERAFAQSNDLIKHLRSHLGENVYKCELCPRAFRLASELREHFAQHKNEDEETRRRNLNALMEEEQRLRINLSSNLPSDLPIPTKN